MLSLFFSLIESKRKRHYWISNDNEYPIATVDSDNGLNVRSQPSTSSSRITAIANGQKVAITGGSGQWWRINYQGINGYCFSEYLRVPAKVSSDGGLRIRSGPSTDYERIGGMPDGASCTITKRENDGWYRVEYNGITGYSSAEYIKLSKESTPEPGPAPQPSGEVIRQGDSRFNSNIRKWGCAFMSCCWCGGVNSISGCTHLYNVAVQNGWMESDCYIKNWNAMAVNIGKAKSFEWASSGAVPPGNCKEILKCVNSRTSSHFVVGNGNGDVEYDPYAPGLVAYEDCVNKRFFYY